MKIAVVGTGISGLLTARLLCDAHEVHVFERESTPGGHAMTVDAHAFGGRHPVDVGFMVFNERTYPNFARLLEILRVPSRASDMSFAVRCDRTGQEYCGSSLRGLFARPSNMIRPSFLRLLRDVTRFYRDAPRDLDDLSDVESVGEYLARRRLGEEFRTLYLMPMAAAIWSAPPARVLEFPARFLIGFFRNHGLLQVTGHPVWRTIPGGSRVYVRRLIEPYAERIRLDTPVRAVMRHDAGATVVTDDAGAEPFDAVVMATHADVTRRLLSDLDPLEDDVLSAFPYQENAAVLHTDPEFLPRRPNARASWNYLVPSDASLPVAVTYDLSRLQGHATPIPICLTLNRVTEADPARILGAVGFSHPLFGSRSAAAQRRHAEINGRRNTFFCGAYWGNGFHEDGVVSALAVGRLFGKTLDTCEAASTRASSSIAAEGPSRTVSAGAST